MREGFDRILEFVKPLDYYEMKADQRPIVILILGPQAPE